MQESPKDLETFKDWFLIRVAIVFAVVFTGVVIKVNEPGLWALWGFFALPALIAFLIKKFERNQSPPEPK